MTTARGIFDEAGTEWVNLFNYPEMPKDFLPEIIINAKYKGRELGLVVTKEVLEKPRFYIDAMRQSIWQDAEHKKE